VSMGSKSAHKSFCETSSCFKTWCMISVKGTERNIRTYFFPVWISDMRFRIAADRGGSQQDCK
jgi:hypothetical protein